MAEVEDKNKGAGSFRALEVQPQQDIQKKDLEKTDPETGIVLLTNDVMAGIITDCAARADNYLAMNSWAANWVLSDIIYQSPQNASPFAGSPGVLQANVPKFTLSNHVNAILPKMVEGIFYDDPPFMLRPRKGTTQQVVEAKTALFAYQLDEMGFRNEVSRTFLQTLILGTGIMKWGWSEYQDTIITYERKGDKFRIKNASGETESLDSPDSDDFERVPKDKLVSKPWIQQVDIRTILVDPGTRVGDIREAKWVIHREYVTYEDLKRLRQQGYEIPSDAELKDFFTRDDQFAPVDNVSMTVPEAQPGLLQHATPRNLSTTPNPLDDKIEMLEYYDCDRVGCVLQSNGKTYCIRNEANPYACIPFYSMNLRDFMDSFYGQGLGQLIGFNQLVDQGITNMALDLLAYCLQPVAIRKTSAGVQDQQIRWSQGRIINVDDDVNKSFSFLTMPQPPAEALTYLRETQAAAAETSGANAQTVMGTGQAGGVATGMRSGTGAAAVVQANAGRLDGPLSKFIDQIFIPWLYKMDELNNALLPTSILKEVLKDEAGIEKIDHIEFRNSVVDFEILAGAHLGARKEMTQVLPILLQLVNSPTITQSINQTFQTWDVVAMIKEMGTLAGWKFVMPFLRAMNPEEKQHYMENTPSALAQKQAAAQQGIQQQKFAQEQQLEEQRQLGKAGGEVIRSVLEHAETPLESTGEAGGVFGS